MTLIDGKATATAIKAEIVEANSPIWLLCSWDMTEVRRPM